MKRVIATVVLALVAVSPVSAHAALTASEKAVVRTFVQKGVADSAGRVRALVGRPDLAPAEIAEPLRAGLVEVPFDAKHQRFVEALLFGPGSAASRTMLVPAVVEGLLARAASRMGDLPVDAPSRIERRAREAASEVVAIHAFIGGRIGNAGSPKDGGHDPGANIRDDALRAAATLYKAHLAAHDAWWHGTSSVAPELLRLRIQAELALVDLGRGVASRTELADWMGLRGARRGVFERRYVLVEADGFATESRVEGAVKLLEAVPHALDDLSLILLSKASPAGLVARHRVVRVGAALPEAMRPVAEGTLWPEEVHPSAPDRGLAAVARAAAELSVLRAFELDGKLQARATAAAEHAARAAASGYLAMTAPATPLVADTGRVAPAGSTVLAAAVQLVLLDGARAAELALIRAGEGRPEPLEQLVLALTVLSAGTTSAVVGRTRPDGGVDLEAATDIASDAGVVSAFVLGGKRFTVAADRDGTFSAQVDGAAPKLTGLGSFRERTTAGDEFRSEGVDYVRLTGEPKVAALDDGRLVVEGGKGAFDALATGADLLDLEVEAEVLPTGTGGGLLLRAAAGDVGYRAVALMLDAAAGQGRLLLMDGRGRAFQLAEPVKLPAAPAGGYRVQLRTTRDKVTAKIGDKTLSATVQSELPPGKVGVAAAAQGRVEIRRLRIRGNR